MPFRCASCLRHLVVALVIATSPGCIWLTTEELCSKVEPGEGGPECEPYTEPAAPEYAPRVRILVLYTPEAGSSMMAAGEDPTVVAAAHVEAASFALSQSGSSVRVRLAGVGVAPFSEGDLAASATDRIERLEEHLRGLLESGDPVLRGERVEAQADLVIVLGSSEELADTRPACAGSYAECSAVPGCDCLAYTNLASVPHLDGADPVGAASAASTWLGDLPFVHAVGRLLGADGDPASLAAFEEGRAPWSDLAHGFCRDVDAVSASAHTVMANPTTACSGRLPTELVMAFSSPVLDHYGEALGAAGDAWNACAVEVLAARVASYFEVLEGSEALATIDPDPDALRERCEGTLSTPGRACLVSGEVTGAEAAALVGCSTLRGDLVLRDVASTRLAPLSSLREIEGRLVVLGPLPDDQVELPRLESVSGGIEIRDVLASEISFPELSSTPSLILDSLPRVTALDVGAVTTLEGSLSVTDAAALTDLSGLAAITSVDALQLEVLPLVPTLAGLTSLTSAESVVVRYMSSLAECDFPSLEVDSVSLYLCEP